MLLGDYVATHYFMKTLHYRGVKSRHNYDEEFMKRLILTKLRQLLFSERKNLRFCQNIM